MTNMNLVFNNVTQFAEYLFYCRVYNILKKYINNFFTCIYFYLIFITYIYHKNSKLYENIPTTRDIYYAFYDKNFVYMK